MALAGKTGLAPIALFAYRRAGHLRRAAESLAANPEAAESDLFVFCDGPRSGRDAGAVAAVRETARALEGFRSVRLVERERNLGLAGSLIAGVTEVVQSRGRVVVVEDDLVLSPHFLSFMNQALVRYSDDARVASVHGYVFPVARKLPGNFFLKGAECWGWATWERAWRHFDADGAALLARIHAARLEHEFDFEGAYPYTEQLASQAEGKLDSWAIRWRASCYLAGMLTLYPGESLVQNGGLDGSGVHRDDSNAFDVALARGAMPVLGVPVEPSEEARAAYASFFRALENPGFLHRARRWVVRLARRQRALD